MISTFAIAIAVASCAPVQSDGPARDIRAELPRDVRLILLGVPSTKPVRTAQASLEKAVDELDTVGRDNAPAAKVEQAKYRVFFRLGQLDDAITTLTQSLRDQERIKGLENYRDFARELQLHSDSLGRLTGASDTPVVAEDEPVDSDSGSAPITAKELVAQLRTEMDQMDRLLADLEVSVRPDEERKAQLERDVGALGQFVFQIRNLTEDIRAAESGQGTVTIDTTEIVRGVQGLVDAIRDMKRERELRGPAPRGLDPATRSIRRDRP